MTEQSIIHVGMIEIKKEELSAEMVEILENDVKKVFSSTPGELSVHGSIYHIDHMHEFEELERLIDGMNYNEAKFLYVSEENPNVSD